MKSEGTKRAFIGREGYHLGSKKSEGAVLKAFYYGLVNALLAGEV